MRYYFIIRILVCSFLTFSQICSHETQIQTQLQQIFPLDQNSELKKETIDRFVKALESIDDYESANTLFSKNKLALERFLANRQVQARASYNSVSGGREGNGIAMLLQSYYQEKVAAIMQPTFSEDKLQALKNLCANSTPAVREAIGVGLYKFLANPIVQQFKEYLKKSETFRAVPPKSTSVSREPSIQSSPIRTTVEPTVSASDTKEPEKDAAIAPVIYTHPNPYGINPALNQALADIAPLMKLINTPSLTHDQKDATEGTDQETTPRDESVEAVRSLSQISPATIVAGICRRIIEPKLRNFVATLALYGPHVLNILQEPSLLVKPFKSFLKKDQNSLDPLEQALKSNLTLLRSILNILETADKEGRTEISKMLKSVASIEELYTFSRDAAIKEFYNQYFDDSNLKNPLDPTAREKFTKDLELLETGQNGSEEEAINLFKKKLKQQFKNRAQSLFRVWKENKIAPGKVGRILKSLAFIVEYPEITQEAFKGYSPVGLYFFSKNTPEKRKDRLFAAIEKHNKDNREKISIQDTSAMWSEFDNFYKIISLGKFASKGVSFLYSAVNLFRKITFRSTRGFEDYEYQHATELQNDIKTSWVGILVNTGKVFIQIGKVVIRGAQTVGWLSLEIGNSRMVQQVYSLAATTKEKAGELLSGAITRFTAMPAAVNRTLNRAKETTRSLFSTLGRRTRDLFTRDSTIQPLQEDDQGESQDTALEPGQEPDMTTIITTAAQGIAPDETDEQEATSLAEDLTSYIVSASSQAGASVAAVGKLITRLSATAFKAAQSDGKFSRNETARIIVETAVRELMEKIEADHKKEGLITDEEKQKQYEEAREALIGKNVASILDEIRAQIDQEQQPKGLRGRYLPVLLGGQKKLTDDDYLKRFNEILEEKIPTITTTLTGEIDTLEGTTARDTEYLSQLVRAQVQKVYDEALKEYKKKGEEVVDDEEYKKELQEIITAATKKILADITTEMLAQRGRLSDAQYSEQFQKSLETKITTSQENLKNQFDALEKKHERVGFQDAIETESAKPPIEPISIRILPKEPTIDSKDDVTTYERAASDRVFAFPNGSAQLSSFQKALLLCDDHSRPNSHHPLWTLLSSTIESVNLQSDSYRAELQSTGVESFCQGLDSPNAVSRLTDGASSLTNILRQLETTDHNDLIALIKGTRIAGVLAHDALIEDFFTNYCDIQPDEKKDLLTIMTDTNPKLEELIPYLKPEYQQDAAKLFNTLQHHLQLPTRLETPLFFLEHHKTIVSILKGSQLSDQKSITKIFSETKQRVTQDQIAKMLPMLKEYSKAMNFFASRRVQSVKSLGYKLKNLFRLSSKAQEEVVREHAFKTLGDFKLAIKGSWIAGLKSSLLPDAITHPQQTSTADLLKFISDSQPEADPSAAHSVVDEEQSVIQEVATIPSDVARITRSTDVIHLFLQGLTGLKSESTEASYQDSYSTISNYINGTSPELPLGELLRAMAPTKATDPIIRARALCGIILLDALKGNSTAKLDRDSFAKLIDKLYAKVANGKTLTLEDFNHQLQPISSDDINHMITDAMSENLDISAGDETHGETLVGLSTRPRAGSTVSNDSFHSLPGDTEGQDHESDDQFYDFPTEQEQKAEQQKQEELREKQHQQELFQEEQHGAKRPGSPAETGTGEIEAAHA